MKAELTILSTTLEKAHTSAGKEFAKFFGETPYDTVEEEAHTERSSVGGIAPYWRCRFVAKSRSTIKGGFEA